MNLVFVIGGSSQGKTEYAKREYPGYFLVDDLELLIRQCLEEENSVDDMLDMLLKDLKAKDSVIVCTEVGYGLVPMDAFERMYRETVGRAGQRIAKAADKVIRICCGIGTAIKG